MKWVVNFQHHIPKTDFVQQKSSLSITGIVFFQNVEPKCKVETTRLGVNYAKDWLDHSFLFHSLVWPGKGFHFGSDHWGQ